MKKFGEMQKAIKAFKTGDLKPKSSIKPKASTFGQQSSIGGIMGTGIRKRRKKP